MDSRTGKGSKRFCRESWSPVLTDLLNTGVELGSFVRRQSLGGRSSLDRAWAVVSAHCGSS